MGTKNHLWKINQEYTSARYPETCIAHSIIATVEKSVKEAISEQNKHTKLLKSLYDHDTEYGGIILIEYIGAITNQPTSAGGH